MRFRLQFGMDNAAFDDQPATEAARILRHVAAYVENGAIPPAEGMAILDANGNRVGSWSIEE